MSLLRKCSNGTMFKSGNLRVIFTGIVTNTIFVAIGCALSYPSPAVSNINDNRNPFHVNIEDQSWFGSLYLLGYTIGATTCGSIADAFGRKLTIMFSSAFCIIGFTVVASAAHIYTIYIGLIIAGFFSVINAASVVLYCSEIASEDNRGILVSMCGTMSNVGTVAVLLVGSYIPWNWLAIFIAGIYAGPPLIVVFLPESPRWFLLKGNSEAAAHGLRWFRGDGGDTDTEMNVIGKSMVEAPKGMSAFKDLLKRKNAKSLFICLILYLLQGFCGINIVLIFTVTIFQLANVDMDPNFQSVVTGLFSLLGGVVNLFLIERCGRRPLLLFSTVFTAIAMAIVAAFFQVQQLNPDYATRRLFWVPILGLSLCTFMFSLGLSTVPWVFACELFSTNVRGTVMTVSTVLYTLAAFAATKTFGNIVVAIQISGAFWFYSACGAAGIVFIVVFVKEPKQEILQ